MAQLVEDIERIPPGVARAGTVAGGQVSIS
jgi:hypothetical protein